jgi:hypothetical protein
LGRLRAQMHKILSSTTIYDLVPLQNA